MTIELTDKQRKIMREVMRQIGRQTSPKKAKAARENGKKGGRPRKQKAEDDGLVRKEEHETGKRSA